MEITRELLLPAPTEEVWEALTDPDRLAEEKRRGLTIDLGRLPLGQR